MPRRHCGSLSLSLTLLPDSAGYTVRITERRRLLSVQTVRLPAAERRASDDPAVVDEAAHAALSFAGHDGVDLDSAEHTGQDWPVWSIRRSR